MGSLLTLLFLAISIGSFINKQTQKDARQKARDPKTVKSPHREGRQQSDAYRTKQQNKPGYHTAQQKQRREPSEGRAQKVGNGIERIPDNGLYEGMEFEEHTKTGSLAYSGQAADEKGKQYDSGIRDRIKVYEESDKEIPEAGPAEIGDLLDFSPEDMFRSIVMAEILGEPRSLRRNIR